MESGPLAEVPLPSLFPHATNDDLDRIRRAATAFDRARLEYGITWEWALQHATFSETPTTGIPEILLAVITVDSQDSDWLEFDLDVEWTPHGLLRVVAAVSVACWCDTDHNTHYVDQVTLTIDQETRLGEAFETASRQMISWARDPHTPPWWRAEAGLPSR